MKKNLLFTIAILLTLGCVTGCKKESKIAKIKSAFNIECVDKKDDSTGIEIQNTAIYYFNEEQYTIAYSVKTTQKFNDKSTYKTYKEAQKETVKDDSNKNITYELETDDKKMNLVFTMTVKNINADDAQTEKEKKELKAVNVLKTLKEEGNTCSINGISKNKIK